MMCCRHPLILILILILFPDNIKSALERQFGRPVDNATHASTPSKLLTGSPSSRGLDRIRERVAQLHLDQVRLSPAVIDLISGTTAGFLTGLLTNPMDVVTARLMTQKADLAKELLPAFRASVGAPYRGLGDCAMRMLREEGLSSFLIGVKSRVGWIAPFTAISLGLNNVLRRRAERAHAARALPLAL
jgi:Mitochondrial carrier protein